MDHTDDFDAFGPNVVNNSVGMLQQFANLGDIKLRHNASGKGERGVCVLRRVSLSTMRLA